MRTPGIAGVVVAGAVLGGCGADLDEAHADAIERPDPAHRPDRAGRAELTLFSDPTDPFAVEGWQLLESLRPQYGEQVRFAATDNSSVRSLARMDALGLSVRGFALQDRRGRSVWTCENSIPDVETVRRALDELLAGPSSER